MRVRMGAIFGLTLAGCATGTPPDKDSADSGDDTADTGDTEEDCTEALPAPPPGPRLGMDACEFLDVQVRAVPELSGCVPFNAEPWVRTAGPASEYVGGWNCPDDQAVSLIALTVVEGDLVSAEVLSTEFDGPVTTDFDERGLAWNGEAEVVVRAADGALGRLAWPGADLALADGRVYVAAGNGDGWSGTYVFGEGLTGTMTLADADSATEGWRSLEPIHDVDGDGLDDVLAMGRDENEFSTALYRGAAPGEAGPEPINALGAYDAVAAGDQDGDGLGDVFMSTGDDIHVLVGPDLAPYALVELVGDWGITVAPGEVRPVGVVQIENAPTAAEAFRAFDIPSCGAFGFVEISTPFGVEGARRQDFAWGGLDYLLLTGYMEDDEHRFVHAYVDGEW